MTSMSDQDVLNTLSCTQIRWSQAAGAMKLQLDRARLAVLLLSAGELRRLENGHDVLSHREFAEDGCLLGQIADAQLRPLVHRHPADLHIRNIDIAKGWLFQTDNHIKCRRFAGAVRSQQSDNFPFVNPQGNPIDYIAALIGFYQIFCFNMHA